MAVNRIFMTQETLDRWLELGRATLAGDLMELSPTGHRLTIRTGLRFEREVSEGNDALGLLGKVKDLSQIASLGGEYASGSVLVGDAAYEVTEGFLGEPLLGTQPAGTAGKA